MKRENVETTQKKITFKLADVVFPELETIFANMTEEIEVIGRVTFISDGGNEEEKFAIIDVPGITIPVIVPKDKITQLMEENRNREREGEHRRWAEAM